MKTLRILTRAVLHRHVTNVWERQRGKNFCKRLVASMAKTMAAVIEAQGGATKY